MDPLGPAKLNLDSSQKTTSPDHNAGEKGKAHEATVRARTNAVAGGFNTSGKLDKAGVKNDPAQPPRVTSDPHLITYSTTDNAMHAMAAPSYSSVSSSAQPAPSQTSMQASQPPMWSGTQKLDFSQPEVVRSVEQAVLHAEKEDLANLVEQGAAKHVSAEVRKRMMERLMIMDSSPPLPKDRLTSVVQTLLDAGVDAKGSADSGPYITLAAVHDDVALVTLLAERGADINAQDKNGYTALMHLAKSNTDGDAQLSIMYLKKFEPDINIVNKTGKNAVMLAAGRGNANCLKTLVRLGAKLDQKDFRHEGLLIMAVHSQDIDTVKAALEAGVKVDQRDKSKETALFHAIRTGSTDIVKLLINNKADVNKRNHKGETPLAIACQKGCPDEIIEALLGAGADPGILDYQRRSPISMANEQNRGRYEAIFARAKFFDAIKANDTDAIRQLCHAHRLDVNTPNQSGDTPLVHACKSGCSVKTIHQLIWLGADPNLVDRNGNKPIFYASEKRWSQYDELFRRHS